MANHCLECGTPFELYKIDFLSNSKRHLLPWVKTLLLRAVKERFGLQLTWPPKYTVRAVMILNMGIDPTFVVHANMVS